MPNTRLYFTLTVQGEQAAHDKIGTFFHGMEYVRPFRGHYIVQSTGGDNRSFTANKLKELYESGYVFSVILSPYRVPKPQDYDIRLNTPYGDRLGEGIKLITSK